MPELLNSILREDDNYRIYGKSDPRYLSELWCRVFIQKRDYAWDYFAAYYRNGCLRWSASFQVNVEVFDDLYQDVLEKLMIVMTPEKLRAFESPWALNNYVRTILWSKWQDHLRREQRRQRYLAQDTYLSDDENDPAEQLQAIPDSTPSPDEQLANAELSAQLWACVESAIKNEIERFIIYQIYVNGRKPREIAPLLAAEHNVSLSAKQVSDKRYNFLKRLTSKLPCADLLALI